jgi:2-keto-3-deoxy-L-rhamnonate aldolase RhmA
VSSPRDRSAPLKERIRRRERLLGTFVKSPDGSVAEILACAGFDYLIADLDHSALGLRELEGIVRAAAVWSVPVIVRLTPDGLHEAGRVLDAGAAGVQISDVVRAETLETANRFCSYPPAGRRSLALSHRAARFGRTPADEHLEQAARELVVVGQVETAAGFDALPGLLAAEPLVDAWFLGPLDLSASMGLPGRVDDAAVLSRLEDGADSLRSAGAPFGIFSRDVAEGRRWTSRGATMVAVGSDYALLSAQAAEIARAWQSE